MFHHEIYFTILFIAVSSASTVNCPKNETCNCESNELGNFQIFCEVYDSSIEIIIEPGRSMEITCSNSKWSDFNLKDLIKGEMNEMKFYMCDLPTNNSLQTITKMLGATDVKKLIFHSYKNVSFFKREHLKNFPNLSYLDLSNNNLLNLDQELLADLPKLKLLKLGKNNLRNVDLFFKYVPELQELNLENNILQSIPNKLSDLKNLIRLSLKKNNLTKLQSGTFDKLVKLKALVLRLNNLISLPKDIFGKLINLDTLNLAKNNFTSLPQYLLQNNTNLRNIDLSFNKRKLNTLPNGFFRNLNKLETLKLKENGLTSLPKDLLWGCSSLTSLILSGNNIKSLPTNIFWSLDNLTELRINSNKIKKFSFNTLNLSRLQKLDVSNNYISSITDQVIFFSLDLEELNMAQNYLRHIPDHIFLMSRKLKILNFSHNYLTLYQDSNIFIDDNGISSPFDFCISLEELYLADNSISKIFSDWNFNLPNLRILDLKHNYISSIFTENLQFVSENIKVDLTYNKIQHINLHNAEEFLKHEKPHRAIILVDNNPLHCGCEIYDFLRYLEGKMDPSVTRYLSIIPGSLTCKTSNVGLVTKLQSESFMCKPKESIFTSMCPKDCNCTQKMHQNVFTMDCAHNNFTSMPNITRKLLNFQKIELDFHYNYLTQMPNLGELGRPVSKLILYDNKISEVILGGLSKTLEVLELHNNNISKISSNVLNFLRNATNLTTLTLRGNPWICDCNTTDFLDFVLRKSKIIIDLHNVTCYDKDKLLANMTITDLCPSYTTNKKNKTQYTIRHITLFIFVFVGFILGISGLFFYIYQSQIKRKLFIYRMMVEKKEEN